MDEEGIRETLKELVRNLSEEYNHKHHYSEVVITQYKKDNHWDRIFQLATLHQ